MSVYNELRLEQQFCDAVIRVDNVEFPAHKIILCNCSPYFIALFTRWSTPDSRVFDIPNVSPDIMKLIIEFAYTEFVPLTRGNIQELFVAADQFNVEGIIQAICHGLEEHLAPDNCISILRLTDVYPELNHKAFLYTMNHFEEIALTSEEFLLLSVQELVKIIENDQLNVKHEKVVFAAILRWIACAIEERREYIALLLSKVRLAVTSVEYIAVSVINNELVRGSKECRPILTRALHDLHTNIFSDSILYTPLARPRLPPAILLAVGGWDDGRPRNIIEAYDIRADRWVNVPNKEENIPQAYHGAVFLDGSVYCVGGFNGFEQLSSVHRFDLGTHTWQEVTQMHSPRCYLSTTVMDGCIYAMGGCDGHERLRSAERYQPRINQWNVIAPMHERRSDASCTTINGKVYICGGFNESGSLSTAECYDPETNQWTLIAPMSSRRSGLGVIVFADRIFAVGGFNGTSRLDTAEAYDPHTNTWHAVPSMLNSRSNFGIAVIDDRLFVAGGYGGSNTMCEVECFDAETCEWSDVRRMEKSHSGLSCCVVYGLPNLAEYSAPRGTLPLPDVEEDEIEY